MASIDLDAVQSRFSEFDETHLATWKTYLDSEAGRIPMMIQEMKLDAFFTEQAGDVVETLTRGDEPDPDFLAQHGPRKVGPRTVYAVQAGTVGGRPVGIVYTDAFEKIREGISNRFILKEIGGSLTIIARQSWTGGQWKPAGGQRVTVSTGGETRKLVAPDDEDSKAIYDAL